MTIRAPDRRELLGLAAGSLGLLAAAPARAARPLGLAAAAKAGGLVYGAAAGPELFTDAAYRALFLDQAALLVPQNAMKFDALQPAEGHFAFAAADAAVDGALAHGLLARGTALFWNDWLPSWLKALSHRQVARAFDVYLDTIVPHFAGRLQSWDVVNEPFWLGRDRPGTFRPGAWYDALGDRYIYRAFARAAELDPHAKLVLNEAWTERTDPVGLAVRRALLRLIDEIQHRGLKLDAVGLQAHLTPQIAYSDASFADFLGEIASRKIEIYITEFDVLDSTYPDAVAARDAAVAARTASFLGAVLAEPAVTMVVTWGLSDRYSWWRDPSTMAAYGLDRLPRPLPYDDTLVRKPMGEAMATAFAGRRKAAVSHG